MRVLCKFLPLIFFVLQIWPASAWAAADSEQNLVLTGHFVGIFSLVIFIVAYLVVMAEEVMHMRKSKPVILAAGLIWALVASIAQDYGVDSEQMREVVFHNLRNMPRCSSSCWWP